MASSALARSSSSSACMARCMLSATPRMSRANWEIGIDLHVRRSRGRSALRACSPCRQGVRSDAGPSCRPARGRARSRPSARRPRRRAAPPGRLAGAGVGPAFKLGSVVVLVHGARDIRAKAEKSSGVLGSRSLGSEGPSSGWTGKKKKKARPETKAQEPSPADARRCSRPSG